MPYTVLAKLYKGAMSHQASIQPERFDALEAVGFKLERDGSLGDNIFARYGGHYVDVGASKKISDGLVRTDHTTFKYIVSSY